MAIAKDGMYQFLISFAKKNDKWKKKIQDLLLKVAAGSIIKVRERALLAYVRISD